MGSKSLLLLRGEFSLPTGVSNVTVTGRFKQYTEQYIDEQLMGQIEGFLKEQVGGLVNEQLEEQAGALLDGMLRGLTDLNTIYIPVVEVDTIQ
ncbi:hypothetical protein D3C81_1352420 [compost metagenome]